MASVVGIGKSDFAAGEDFYQTFIKTSQLGSGIAGDLFWLSFGYIPLMAAAMFVRDSDVDTRAFQALKTPYNLVMTLFSLYCFVTMALWRFDPNFSGETHGGCATALSATMAVAGVTVGSFRTTAALFFWSK